MHSCCYGLRCKFELYNRIACFMPTLLLNILVCVWVLLYCDTGCMTTPVSIKRGGSTASVQIDSNLKQAALAFPSVLISTLSIKRNVGAWAVRIASTYMAAFQAAETL